MTAPGPNTKRRWRFYRTVRGRCDVADFLDALGEDDALSVAAAMKDVAVEGLTVARHLRGDIYEVRASGRDVIYRILFATEGESSQVLLGLEAFAKKTQQTPARYIDNAEARLRDWRERGAELRRVQGRE
jgi:phage-related protein